MPTSQVPHPGVSQKDNPAIPDESPRRPEFDTGVDPERPQELVDRLAEIERQDVTAPGPQAGHPRPYALPGEDEGPLGDGGQLRGPDAGGGGSS